MVGGPIFGREVLIVPRSLRHYLLRSGYVAALFLLMYTASQTVFGWQQVRNVGDVARFGTLVFQLFSIVQLTLVLFFALLFAAGNVAQEKDRQTLILLLMTDQSDWELVLGKLSASLLTVAVLLAASAPAFTLLQLLGGVSLDQIGWMLALCAAVALAAGSWGSLVAFWREKTFQTLATSVIGAVLFVGVIEAVIAAFGINSTIGRSAALFNPFRALLQILDPLGNEHEGQTQLWQPVAALSGLAVVLIVITIARLRVWNPSRAMFIAPTKEEEESAAAALARTKTRPIWSNPVIWREICTKAYGNRVFVIKLAYLLLAAFAGYYLWTSENQSELVMGMISPAGFAFVALTLLSLIIINAQAVTALTSERDGKTLELLLVTDITAKEFIFGKLGGIFYNTKELILVPCALLVYFVAQGQLTPENFAYVMLSFFVLLAFTAMLGLHAGLSYDNSRTAIANSLGTMFFLFVGVFIFMILLVEARSSFLLQFQSFLVIIVAGSIGLWTSLTHRNPSPALGVAAACLPFLTFYAITEFLLQGTLGVCLAILWAYGFATVAMLIPAVSEFDVALGRTTLDKG